MLLRYRKGGQNKKTAFDNHDVSFHLSASSHRTTITISAKEDIELISAEDVIPFHVNFADHYFFNGYQSWTDSHEYPLAKRMRNIKKSPHIITKKFALDMYGDSKFHDYSIRKSHGYDFFYAKGEYEAFLYNLNYEIAYLLIEVIKDSRDLHISSDLEGLRLQKGENVVIFDYRLFYDFEEGKEAFEQDFPKLNKEKIFGYTSWYNYYQNINEEIILRDLDALDSRFQVFQIDDGYETFVGDWLDVDSKKFPNGLEPIVKKIHEKGLKAGLWLAPFAAETNSKLFHEHPEWFLKDKNGHFLKAGGNWSQFYALDLNNEQAMDYVRACLRHYSEMGFDFFKLDFLYAIAIALHPGETRCQSQRRAYQILRDTLGDKLILGCGANISNSFPYFDYLRIGPDVSLNFDDSTVMRLFHRERVSTKITLQNTIYRSLFDDHLFANDPDVFLLRDENIELSKEQRKALTFINALFGSVLFTSDDIATYDEEKKKLLEQALDLFHNAEDVAHQSEDNYISITYRLRGAEHELVYQPSKGVFTHER